MENITNGLNSFDGEQGQFTKNEAKLWAYLLKLPRHPQVIDHKGIAASFNVSNYKPIFRADALRRFLFETSKEPTTAATVAKRTGLAHKYICQLKRTLEEQGRIKVICLGRCPTTGSNGVQFLLSNSQTAMP